MSRSTQRITNVRTLTNFNEFKSTVGKHGYSMSNLYDIIFELPSSTNVFNSLLEQFRGADGDDPTGVAECLNLMRLYTTECTMPGVTMSDSEYRVTNTPQLKYAYGAVFNEFSVTFLLDADSLIRKVFDKWTNTIFPYSRFRGSTSNTGPLRTAYKDDYISDISVVKYERVGSSKRNNQNKRYIPLGRIIPDSDTRESSAAQGTNFAENVAVHAVKMKNAFPKSLQSMSLTGDAGNLAQFSVTFEFESLQVSTLTELQSFNGFFERTDQFSLNDTVGDFVNNGFRFLV